MTNTTSLKTKTDVGDKRGFKKKQSSLSIMAKRGSRDQRLIPSPIRRQKMINAMGLKKLGYRGRQTRRQHRALKHLIYTLALQAHPCRPHNILKQSLHYKEAIQLPHISLGLAVIGRSETQSHLAQSMSLRQACQNRRFQSQLSENSLQQAFLTTRGSQDRIFP